MSRKQDEIDHECRFATFTGGIRRCPWCFAIEPEADVLPFAEIDELVEAVDEEEGPADGAEEDN